MLMFDRSVAYQFVLGLPWSVIAVPVLITTLHTYIIEGIVARTDVMKSSLALKSGSHDWVTSEIECVDLHS